MIFGRVVGLFGLLVVGIILVTLLAKKVLQINEEMISRPWPSIGRGAVTFLVVPLIVILLLVTIIGIPLALISIPLYLVLIYLSKVMAGFALGLLILNRMSPEKYKGSLIWPLVLGSVIIMIICSIPFLGWIVNLFLIWWAMGSIIKIIKEGVKEYR